MKTPTIAMVLAALPAWGFKLTDWSNNTGDDCKAIQGLQHVLYHDAFGWSVQEFIEFNDASVGIFGQMDPGPLRHSEADVYVVVGFFLRYEAAVAASYASERLSESLREEDA